jgi:hypothetical protein
MWMLRPSINVRNISDAEEVLRPTSRWHKQHKCVEKIPPPNYEDRINDTFYIYPRVEKPCIDLFNALKAASNQSRWIRTLWTTTDQSNLSCHPIGTSSILHGKVLKLQKNQEQLPRPLTSYTYMPLSLKPNKSHVHSSDPPTSCLNALLCKSRQTCSVCAPDKPYTPLPKYNEVIQHGKLGGRKITNQSQQLNSDGARCWHATTAAAFNEIWKLTLLLFVFYLMMPPAAPLTRGMINKWWTGNDFAGNGPGPIYSTDCPGICLNELRKTTENLSQDSQSLDQDSNPRPPARKTSVTHWSAKTDTVGLLYIHLKILCRLQRLQHRIWWEYNGDISHKTRKTDWTHWRGGGGGGASRPPCKLSSGLHICKLKVNVW